MSPTDNWHYPLSENQLRHLVMQAVEGERERMKSEGYRKCAEGQKTTQYCGLLEAAVEAEREACARVCEAGIKAERYPTLTEIAVTIRARG